MKADTSRPLAAISGQSLVDRRLLRREDDTEFTDLVGVSLRGSELDPLPRLGRVFGATQIESARPLNMLCDLPDPGAGGQTKRKVAPSAKEPIIQEPLPCSAPDRC